MRVTWEVMTLSMVLAVAATGSAAITMLFAAILA